MARVIALVAVEANFLTVDLGSSYLKATHWQHQAAGIERRGLVRLLRRSVDLSQQLAACCGQLLSSCGQSPLESTSQTRQAIHLLSSQPLRVVALGAEQALTRESSEQLLLTVSGAVLVGIITADERRGKVELVNKLQQLAADLVLLFAADAGAETNGSWLVGLLEGLALSNQTKPASVVYDGAAPAGQMIARLLGPGCDLHILPQTAVQPEASAALRSIIDGLVKQRLQPFCTAAWLVDADCSQTASALRRTVAAYSTPSETDLVIDLGAEMTEVITERQAGLASTSSPYGLHGGLLRAADSMDFARLRQWLGRAIDRRDWLDWCGNCSLLASGAPADDPTTQPLLRAMAREIIRLAVAEHQRRWPTQLQAASPRQTWWERLGPETPPPICPTRIVGTGGLFAFGCAPGEAAAILLDGVRPAGVVAVYRDRDAIWPQLGALQPDDPLTVGQLLPSTLELLTTAICPYNCSQKDRQLLDIKISGSHNHSFRLQAGELVTLSNTAGQIWEVELRPVREVDVGAGPGISVLHRLSGGTIGLTFDGRVLPVGKAAPRIANRQQRPRGRQDA